MKLLSKNGIRAAFDDRASPYFLYANGIIFIATFVSLISSAFEFLGLEDMETFLEVQWGTTIVFTVEYLLRLLSAEPKRAYIFSVMGVIDLVSILPTYLGLGNFTFLKTVRASRMLRLLGFIGMQRFFPSKRKIDKARKTARRSEP